MKKLFYLLLVSMALTSCFSHTPLKNNSPSMHPHEYMDYDRPLERR
jgi:uncharacterized protein YcfL